MRLFGKKHNQKTLRFLHDQGIEMTPAELETGRRAAYDTIRCEMKKCGLELPESDEDLFFLMKEVMKHES